MIIEDKFQNVKNYLSTKQDLTEMEKRLNRNMYIVGVVQHIE